MKFDQFDQFEFETRVAARDARNAGFSETADAIEKLADELQLLALQQVMEVPPGICFGSQTENLH